MQPAAATDQFPATSDGALWRWILLLALASSFVALFPFAAISGDQARDLRIAADIAGGVNWPLTGPVLAGTFHLGPLWYYWLAGLLAVGLETMGIHFLLAALAALQFPLVYHAGRLWRGQTTGLVWASLLLVPSWGLYEQVFPGHTSLTGVTVAAVLLVSIRVLRRPGTLHLYLLAALCMLAVHAHPTAVLLLPIPLISFLSAWRYHGTPFRHLVAAALLPLILLLPALVDGSWMPSAALNQYFSSDQAQGSVAQLGPLAWQLTGGPLYYWLTEVAQWTPATALAITLLWTGVIAVGLLGALRCCWLGDRIGTLILVTLALSLLGLALGRAIFPYYMLAVSRILLLGAVAAGWSIWLTRPPQWMAAAALCLLLYWCTAAPAMLHLKSGTWPFGFTPLFHVTAPWQESAPLGLTTTVGLRQGGRLLCHLQPDAIHGGWGQMLIISYAVEARLACNLGDTQVGGHTTGDNHWIGLPKALADLAGQSATYHAGAWRLFPVDRVLAPDVGVNVPADIPDPPEPSLPIPGPDSVRQTVLVEPHESAILAISNLAFGIAPAPVMQLWCAGRTRQALASDSVSTLFRLDCSDPLLLEYETRAPEHLDIVVF